MMESSYAPIWREYVENGDEQITIGMPFRGKGMTLSWANGEYLRFSGRKACLRWLGQACPDSCVWGGYLGGPTVCAGCVRELCKRAGVNLKPRKAVV